MKAWPMILAVATSATLPMLAFAESTGLEPRIATITIEQAGLVIIVK